MDDHGILHQCESMQEDELTVLEVWHFLQSHSTANEILSDENVITVYISWSDQNTSQSR